MYNPPVNPGGKAGGLVAQAFAVVIVGLCKFNIKWVLIFIVKIWSKTCTSLRNNSNSLKSSDQWLQTYTGYNFIVFN